MIKFISKILLIINFTVTVLPSTSVVACTINGECSDEECPKKSLASSSKGWVHDERQRQNLPPLVKRVIDKAAAAPEAPAKTEFNGIINKVLAAHPQNLIQFSELLFDFQQEFHGLKFSDQQQAAVKAYIKLFIDNPHAGASINLDTSAGKTVICVMGMIMQQQLSHIAKNADVLKLPDAIRYELMEKKIGEIPRVNYVICTDVLKQQWRDTLELFYNFINKGEPWNIIFSQARLAYSQQQISAQDFVFINKVHFSPARSSSVARKKLEKAARKEVEFSYESMAALVLAIKTQFPGHHSQALTAIETELTKLKAKPVDSWKTAFSVSLLDELAQIESELPSLHTECEIARSAQNLAHNGFLTSPFQRVPAAALVLDEYGEYSTRTSQVMAAVLSYNSKHLPFTVAVTATPMAPRFHCSAQIRLPEILLGLTPSLFAPQNSLKYDQVFEKYTISEQSLQGAQAYPTPYAAKYVHYRLRPHESFHSSFSDLLHTMTGKLAATLPHTQDFNGQTPDMRCQRATNSNITRFINQHNCIATGPIYEQQCQEHAFATKELRESTRASVQSDVEIKGEYLAALRARFGHFEEKLKAISTPGELSTAVDTTILGFYLLEVGRLDILNGLFRTKAGLAKKKYDPEQLDSLYIELTSHFVNTLIKLYSQHFVSSTISSVLLQDLFIWQKLSKPTRVLASYLHMLRQHRDVFYKDTQPLEFVEPVSCSALTQAMGREALNLNPLNGKQVGQKVVIYGTGSALEEEPLSLLSDRNFRREIERLLWSFSHRHKDKELPVLPSLLVRYNIFPHLVTDWGGFLVPFAQIKTAVDVQKFSKSKTATTGIVKGMARGLNAFDGMCAMVPCPRSSNTEFVSQVRGRIARLSSEELGCLTQFCLTSEHGFSYGLQTSAIGYDLRYYINLLYSNDKDAELVFGATTVAHHGLQKLRDYFSPLRVVASPPPMQFGKAELNPSNIQLLEEFIALQKEAHALSRATQSNAKQSLSKKKVASLLELDITTDCQIMSLDELRARNQDLICRCLPDLFPTGFNGSALFNFGQRVVRYELPVVDLVAKTYIDGLISQMTQSATAFTREPTPGGKRKAAEAGEEMAGGDDKRARANEKVDMNALKAFHAQLNRD